MNVARLGRAPDLTTDPLSRCVGSAEPPTDRDRSRQLPVRQTVPMLPTQWPVFASFVRPNQRPEVLQRRPPQRLVSDREVTAEVTNPENKVLKKASYANVTRKCWQDWPVGRLGDDWTETRPMSSIKSFINMYSNIYD